MPLRACRDPDGRQPASRVKGGVQPVRGDVQPGMVRVSRAL
jgi:hypothetical protein